MKFNGLIIPRSYNEYINKTDLQAIKQAVASGTDSALNINSVQPVQNRVIAAIIPQDITEENPLATENFVNESVATNSAYFRGTYNSLAELEAYSGEKTNNDYAWVMTNNGSVYQRYKWDTEAWVYEYELNLANADILFNVSHPIGEIYVQFPLQLNPAELYGRGTWSDITADYAGLFFRAAGGDAAEFGQTQNEGLPDINGTLENIRCRSANGSGAFSITSLYKTQTDAATETNQRGCSIAFNASDANEIYGASEHVTPVNTAIKIWKRTA